jgi:glutathione S-transferase
MHSPAKTEATEFRLWGVIASPYLLKMQSLLDYAERSWQRWPDQGSPWRARLMAARLQLAKRKKTVKRFPAISENLDEYPSVPFYCLEGQGFYYDSTGLALHLDHQPESQVPPLMPEDPALSFLCKLIDSAFSEFGLYMVHHMRWIGSAQTTSMGVRTAAEMRYLLPGGLQNKQAEALPRRQVRRCPYLFSVAPKGYAAGVPELLTPPSREGFPPTHDLLDAAWVAYLAAMEKVLSSQDYLLGDRFSLADASAYGQLSMNLIDGAATDRLAALAPRTFQWLCDIRDGKHVGGRGELYFSEALIPLLEVIGASFVQLMLQNRVAYQQAIASGETVFNEAAFNAGRALYDGTLMGHPFRAVVKTFQLRVWRDLVRDWQELPPSGRELVRQYLDVDTCALLEADVEFFSHD